MKLTILGSGTSTGVPQVGCTCETCLSTDPRDRRLRCSSLVEIDSKRILIDCSPDFREQMMRLPFAPIDAIFITHEHYDHVGGLDDLRPFCKFGDITVYAESYCANHLRQRIPYCFTTPENRYPGVPSIDLVCLEPHIPVCIAQGIDVIPFRVMHGKLPILGFRIGSLAYITDMKTIPEEELSYVTDVEVLVVNALRHEPHNTHQTIEDAIEFSRMVRARKTYFIHMSHHVRPHTIEQVKLPSDFYLAYDGLEIEIPSKRVLVTSIHV